MVAYILFLVCVFVSVFAVARLFLKCAMVVGSSVLLAHSKVDKYKISIIFETTILAICVTYMVWFVGV